MQQIKHVPADSANSERSSSRDRSGLLDLQTNYRYSRLVMALSVLLLTLRWELTVEAANHDSVLEIVHERRQLTTAHPGRTFHFGWLRLRL